MTREVTYITKDGKRFSDETKARDWEAQQEYLRSVAHYKVKLNEAISRKNYLKDHELPHTFERYMFFKKMTDKEYQEYIKDDMGPSCSISLWEARLCRYEDINRYFKKLKLLQRELRGVKYTIKEYNDAIRKMEGK